MSTRRDSDTPILSLASEITIEIFKHCLPPCDDPWPNPRFLENLSSDLPWPSPSEGPLLVAQICHQWREICLEAPELWAAVAFGDTRSIELLETWLLRARNHPLTLFIESEDFDRATTLLHTLIPYRHQWQEVHFSLPLSTLRQLNDTTAFPRLERLTLAVQWQSSKGTSDPVIIRGAPLLHFAQIFNVPDVIIDPPSSHLSSLHLTYTGTAMLRCCPNLMDLYCHASHTDESPPIHLPALRSLNIGNKKTLGFFMSPRLERLQITIVDASADADLLETMVTRSSCELQFLDIGLASGIAGCLQRFLRPVNSMRHLRIHFHSDRDPQIEILKEIDVLPLLKHLDIYAEEEDCGAVLDVARWRAQHTSLESFALYLKSTPTDAVLAEVRLIARPGLRLRVLRRGIRLEPDITVLDTRPA